MENYDLSVMEEWEDKCYQDQVELFEEMCPACESEVMIPVPFGVCSRCGTIILCCSQCEHDPELEYSECDTCPWEEESYGQ